MATDTSGRQAGAGNASLHWWNGNCEQFKQLSADWQDRFCLAKLGSFTRDQADLHCNLAQVLEVSWNDGWAITHVPQTEPVQGAAALPLLPPRSSQVVVVCVLIDSISLLIPILICSLRTRQVRYSDLPLLLTVLLLDREASWGAYIFWNLGSMDAPRLTRRADTWWGVPGGKAGKLVVLAPELLVCILPDEEVHGVSSASAS